LESNVRRSKNTTCGTKRCEECQRRKIREEREDTWNKGDGNKKGVDSHKKRIGTE
jgi:hypothetical protein